MNSEHNKHDRVLVARYAAGDAYASETDDAKRLVDNCHECAALAADIKLISARTSQLPAINRPRDYRISPEQAGKLRGSWFDRLMRGLSNPGFAVVRPLAGAALAIGFALVVIGALPISNLAGGAVPEANPGFTNQAAHATSVPPATNAQSQVRPLSPTEPTVVDNSGGGSAGAPGSPPPPEVGGPPTMLPGAAVDVSPTQKGNDAEAPGSAAPVAAPTPPAPPKMAGSPLPAPTIPQEAFAVPTPAPTPPPASQLIGSASVPLSSESSVDRPLLVIGGLIVAFLALMALGLLTLARRRYSDPLVR
jgi:hypothetical protein